MKELSLEKALKMLEEGKAVECQVSYREDDREVVLTKERLEYLHNLSQQGVQMCKIFEKAQEKVNIPEDSIEMSFDEAYEMVQAGDLVYYQNEGEEEEIISTSELINLRRNFTMRGKDLFLYWHE